jgi:hypothetical protein
MCDVGMVNGNSWFDAKIHKYQPKNCSVKTHFFRIFLL